MSNDGEQLGCHIFVDALPDSRVHIGITENFLDETGAPRHTDVTFTVSAAEAQQLAMLLLARAESSQDPV